MCEYTMHEAELPSMRSQPSLEEMMVRIKKGGLLAGIERSRGAADATDITEGLPSHILHAGSELGPTFPVKL